MKIHIVNSDWDQNKWKVFLTTEDLETFIVHLVNEKKPSNKEIEILFENSPEKFRELSYG